MAADERFDGCVRTVGLAGRPENASVREEAGVLLPKLLSAGLCVRVEPGLIEPCEGCEEGERDFVAQSDMVIALGGDGTFLAVAREAALHGTPVLGLDVGHLGFLAEVVPPAPDEELSRALQGDFTVEPRLMLSAEAHTAEGRRHTFVALNDALVGRRGLGPVTLELRVDGESVITYEADGLIVATPTGSTGYTLSADGPIVAPQVECLIVTPVCAHTLGARPLVVGADARIEVVAGTRPGSGPRPVALIVDGQLSCPLSSGDRVTVTRAPHVARLVRLSKGTFYHRLRTKLGWVGSAPR